MKTIHETPIPVLVGAGQVTQREEDPLKALSPMDLTAAAARKAANDSGAGEKIFPILDSVVQIRSFSDTSWRFRCPFGEYVNPPKSLANRLGAVNAKRLIYPQPGGNTPQWCVNRLFEMISRGEIGAALISGGEALSTQKAAQRAGTQLDWSEDSGGTFEEWGSARQGWSEMEERHRLMSAISAYPMVENAIRGHKGRTIEEHIACMGRLFEGFARVAASNQLADRPAGYSAEEIATVNEKNPFIGFPYTKLMNANVFIDQSAALVLMSTTRAKELGIPKDKWVYLHGCGDANDHWYLSERINYHSSPAMRAVAGVTTKMAGMTMNEIDFFDIYSCFPSAVQIACAEMEIDEEDPRGLTVTGGLPYFGGPGNNYVTHSIAEMMNRVRAKPGTYGLVTANGWYLTKQSAGIYSTAIPEQPFTPVDPVTYQSKIDGNKGPEIVEHAEGKAVIETYTVLHDRKGPSYSILFGRLNDDRRFIANTPPDKDLLQEMESTDFLGRSGHVSTKDGINTFMPN
ncbi:MAG: acetyl-CoA acetyltransferase [SAR324 cluster bacterium]|nr:acetyl-CoA acetyltransferase [SAR324 cluster bacterium]